MIQHEDGATRSKIKVDWRSSWMREKKEEGKEERAKPTKGIGVEFHKLQS